MADYGDYTDLQLLLLVKEGSESAFDEIYDRYWPILLRHAHRILDDEDQCQDVLQDVFVKLWQQAPGLVLHTSLSAYLYTLVRNRILNILSRDQVRTTYLNRLVGEDEHVGERADDKLLERELLVLVHEEVKHMPERMREIYRMSREDQLTHQEISTKLNISISTVKFHLNLALKRLRNRIGR